MQDHLELHRARTLFSLSLSPLSLSLSPRSLIPRLVVHSAVQDHVEGADHVVHVHVAPQRLPRPVHARLLPPQQPQDELGQHLPDYKTSVSLYLNPIHTYLNLSIPTHIHTYENTYDIFLSLSKSVSLYLSLSIEIRRFLSDFFPF